MHQLGDEAAPRVARDVVRFQTRGSSNGSRERKREGRICLAPGCEREISPRTFEITLLAPGVEAYAFTFG
jgi:hypothetical protein